MPLCCIHSLSWTRRATRWAERDWSQIAKALHRLQVSPTWGGLEPSSAGQHSSVPSNLQTVFLEQPQISACGKYAYSVDSNVAFDKIQWPKLYHFPRASDTPTPSQRRQKHPSILKPRRCYVCGTQMFRVRGDEHTGLLFFDRKLVSDAGSDYCSRVLCVVPDALQDQTVTDVTVVWPSSKDSHVTILLLPRGESTMPVLITSDITSRSLLDDVHFGTIDGSGNDGNNTEEKTEIKNTTTTTRSNCHFV